MPEDFEIYCSKCGSTMEPVGLGCGNGWQCPSCQQIVYDEASCIDD